jgi:hypothetical protein
MFSNLHSSVSVDDHLRADENITLQLNTSPVGVKDDVAGEFAAIMDCHPSPACEGMSCGYLHASVQDDIGADLDAKAFQPQDFHAGSEKKLQRVETSDDAHWVDE